MKSIHIISFDFSNVFLSSFPAVEIKQCYFSQAGDFSLHAYISSKTLT